MITFVIIKHDTCNLQHSIRLITFVTQYMTIMNDRFKQILDAKGLNAQKTANLIGIDASAVSHLLNAKRRPSFEVLSKIGQAFPDINLNWLISGSGNMYNGDISEQPATSAQISPSQDGKTEHAHNELLQNQTQQTSTNIEIAKTVAMAPIGKKIARIVLFFNDGSFEDYAKN